MPKTKKIDTTIKKPKLTPEQRSDVAKARWAKKRATNAVQEGTTPPPSPPNLPPYPQNPVPEQPPAAPESQAPEPQQPPTPIVPPVPYSQGEQSPIPTDAIEAIVEARVALVLQGMSDKLSGLTPTPVQQPPPVPQKKQKKTPVPKEFLVALKTADKRLADAIDEYEECSSRINYLVTAIPRLQKTVLALRNESNPDVAPNVNNAFNPVALYNSPQLNPPPAMPQPYIDPLAALQGAAAAPPISRAQGGAIQFGPEVLGNLEGPDDDDDIDKFITGPAASGNWV